MPMPVRKRSTINCPIPLACAVSNEKTPNIAVESSTATRRP
jgi:hypothetical protein